MLALLSDGREATSSELRDEIPLLEGSIAYGEGKSWGGQVAVGPRVLTTLSAAGQIVRATNDGAWTTSRPRWASMESWLGEEIAAHPEAEGVAGLVERWLRAFGPGTVADIKWWLGSTVAAVRRALADLHAVEVDLDGQTGYLLPDDLEATDPVEPWAALLPPLDPTTMGWFERDWYLGPYKAQLFDTSGNAGPTVWWDGRIVGGWRQSDSGEVVLQMLEDVGAEGLSALEREAARLTEWFGGARVLPRFPSPLLEGCCRRGRVIRRYWGCREQPPFVGDSLEPLRAAVRERDPRSGDEILDGARDEHFAPRGERSYAGRDMDRDAADVLVHQLDLAAVQADPHLQAEGARRLRDRLSAPDRPRRAVEGGEVAVAQRLHLASAKPAQLAGEPPLDAPRATRASARLRTPPLAPSSRRCP